MANPSTLSATFRRRLLIAALCGVSAPSVALAYEATTVAECDGSESIVDFSDDHESACPLYVDVASFGTDPLENIGGQACGVVQQVNLIEVVDGVTTATIEFDFEAETDEDFEAGALLGGPMDDLYTNIVTAGFDGGYSPPRFNIKNLLAGGHVVAADVPLVTGTLYHISATFTENGDVTATVSQNGTVLQTLSGNVGQTLDIGTLGAIAGRSPDSGSGAPLDGTYTCIDNLVIDTDGEAPTCDTGGGGTGAVADPGFTITGLVASSVKDANLALLCEDVGVNIAVDWDVSQVSSFGSQNWYSADPTVPNVPWSLAKSTIEATYTIEFDDAACGGPITYSTQNWTSLLMSDGDAGSGTIVSFLTGDHKQLLTVRSEEHGDTDLTTSGDLSWTGNVSWETNSYGKWESAFGTPEVYLRWDTTSQATVEYRTGAATSTDGDGVCDATDVIDDDADGLIDDCEANPGDGDNDGVLDADDVCEGDDALGDVDGDGFCFDLDECDTDPDKLLPGDCGCGSADVDTDGSGISDCLEASLALTADKSHVRWFDTKTGKKRVSGTRVTWDKNKSWANFTGQMELGGGLLAPDFRDATTDEGIGSVQVSMGATSPVTVYDEDLSFDVYDRCSSSTSDNREKWQHRDVELNEYDRKPYSHERAVLRWRNTMRYRSWQESGYPAMGDDDNLGRIHSRFISTDESRVRVRWNRKTDLPLTVALNGVTLVTIEDNGDNTYTVDSAYDSETVFRGNGTERKRVIDVMYPDNLQEGDELVWYSGTDLTGTQLYDQTLEENAASTSNTDSVWYNAGGRFHLRVPIGDDIVDGSLDQATLEAAAAEQVATVTISVGGDDASSGQSVTGSVTYSGYVLSDGHWRISETDEDESDGGTQGGSGGSSSGQGGSQGGTTCQTNASDDPEPAE